MMMNSDIYEITFVISFKFISNKYNIPITFIGANLSKEERERKLREFEEQKTWILITTDLLARGLDFPDVTLVINFDMPVSMVNYIHRVGRTGRGGKAGKAMTFFTNEDKPLVRTQADLLKRSGCEVPDWLFKIKKANKNEMKLLAKRGLKREAISLNPRDQSDPDFNQDIKRQRYYGTDSAHVRPHTMATM